MNLDLRYLDKAVLIQIVNSMGTAAEQSKDGGLDVLDALDSFLEDHLHVRDMSKINEDDEIGDIPELDADLSIFQEDHDEEQ